MGVTLGQAQHQGKVKVMGHGKHNGLQCKWRKAQRNAGIEIEVVWACDAKSTMYEVGRWDGK